MHYKKFLHVLSLFLFIALIGLAMNAGSLAVRPEQRLAVALPATCNPDDGPCPGPSDTPTPSGTPTPTPAATPKVVNAGEIENPLGFDSIDGFLKHISTTLFEISVPIVVIMIIWGGVLWMTAGADPERVIKGRKTITYAILGFVIVLMAQGIVAIVRDLIGGS